MWSVRRRGRVSAMEAREAGMARRAGSGRSMPDRADGRRSWVEVAESGGGDRRRLDGMRSTSARAVSRW